MTKLPELVKNFQHVIRWWLHYNRLTLRIYFLYTVVLLSPGVLTGTIPTNHF